MVRATGRAVVLASSARLVSKDEVVYTSNLLTRISDDRIQFRTQHSVAELSTFQTAGFRHHVA